MDLLHNLFYGFTVCFEPLNLLACFIGVLSGTLVGVLPGIGPAATISILLPITFKMPAATSLIMLSGIYYGAMYGGSTTSILVNIPGEAASVVTCLDGYQMARQGKAGPALGIAAFGSFIAGTFAVLMIMLLAPPLTKLALEFGPPEYVGLLVLAMTMVTYLSGGSFLKSLIMAVLGFILGTIGIDRIRGVYRFTYGITTLTDGVPLPAMVMGLFGISEVFVNIEEGLISQGEVYQAKLKGLLPSLTDWKNSALPIARGSILGFFLGTLPGIGAIIPTFISYSIEKKLSKNPERFGRGAIEGVAGPESANNSAAMGGLLPLLTLGVPANAIMAMLLGGLLIHGVQTGPLLLKQHPDIFWGFIASMYIGNGMLLILNLPLIGIWVKILKAPYPILFALILLFCLVGAYSMNSNYVDALIMVFFGVVGYLMKKLEFEGPPLVLGFILGPLIEESLRQSLLRSGGSFAIFVHRPITGTFLLLSCIIIVLPLGLSLFNFGRKKLDMLNSRKAKTK